MRSEEAAGSVSRNRVDSTGPDARAGWEELVLPEVSRELLRSIAGDLRFRRGAEKEAASGPRARRRPGLRLMFAGEPGTGKRLAARVLATDLGLPIMSVELAGVMGTDAAPEAPLDQLFATAERSRAIIHFTDAGTWIGERAGGRAPRAGGTDPQLASLLEHIDQYRGVVVFSARLGIAATQVLERLDHVVEFPFPDEHARRRIWRLILPDSAQLDERELEFLASSFPLTGGAIKRCAEGALAAAAEDGAPLQLRHLVAAVEREYAGRTQGARVRVAIERFHAGTWDQAPPPAVAGPAAAWGYPHAHEVSWQHSRRRLIAGIALVAALGAAALAFVIAHKPHAAAAPTPALVTQLRSGVLSVSVPASWHRLSPPSGPGVPLSDEIVAGAGVPGTGILILGLTSTPASTLPQPLLRALPHAPTAQIVTLHGTSFYRYLGLTPRGAGGSESVYALPTSAGTVLGQCFQRSAAPAFAATCERVIATVKLASGRVLP